MHFHLARGNALTRHLDGMTALVVVNGPDGYVSPRWYADPAQVPTWNYVALELEGPVRRMDGDGLLGLLEALIARQEARVTDGAAVDHGTRCPKPSCASLLAGIVGFEMEVQAWRPTFKLSQNKPRRRARAASPTGSRRRARPRSPS